MTDSQLRSLKSNIEGMQALMIAYVTDQRDSVQPNEYQNLYFQTAVGLEELGYVDPNPHKSLETFWSYCKLKELNSYASRRAYIRDLYADILLDLERALHKAKDPQHWRHANEELTGPLTPIRQQWLKAKNYIYSTPPDFENSIKESINSLESALKVFTGDSKSTLGQIIKQVDIDSDIGKLLSQAYGLVSKKAFVRHGGTEPENLTQQEAEFFVELAAISIIYLKNKLSVK